jgi:hypothetical protein
VIRRYATLTKVTRPASSPSAVSQSPVSLSPSQDCYSFAAGLKLDALSSAARLCLSSTLCMLIATASSPLHLRHSLVGTLRGLPTRPPHALLCHDRMPPVLLNHALHHVHRRRLCSVPRRLAGDLERHIVVAPVDPSGESYRTCYPDVATPSRMTTRAVRCGAAAAAAGRTTRRGSPGSPPRRRAHATTMKICSVVRSRESPACSTLT